MAAGLSRARNRHSIYRQGQQSQVANTFSRPVEVGKIANYRGGEWVWQVQSIEMAQLLIQTCSLGRETAFENWLLERHFIEHGGFPIANRREHPWELTVGARNRWSATAIPNQTSSDNDLHSIDKEATSHE
jgi:hypothetical protein